MVAAGLFVVVAIAAYLFLVVELSWAYSGPANSPDREVAG